MPYDTKIATCCYCGTRAALVLKGKERHELACSGCGAPLHEMKWLKERPAMPVPAAAPVRQNGGWHGQMRSAKKKKKPKKRKSFSRKFAEELFDFVEDIFD